MNSCRLHWCWLRPLGLLGLFGFSSPLCVLVFGSGDSGGIDGRGSVFTAWSTTLAAVVSACFSFLVWLYCFWGFFFGDLFCPCKASYQTLQIRVVYSLSLGLLHMCINGGFGLKNTTELSVKKTFTKHTNQSHFALRGFHFTDSMLVHAALEVAQTNFWNHWG